jgi:RHS repeat-associated protein
LLITAEVAASQSGVNVAAAGNGAVATASSTIGSLVPSKANNGDHAGTASWWADDTTNSYPDWVQVDFAGTKTISEIDVFGLQQNWGSPVEPTVSMTSSYALTNFEVQYWTGSVWATVPGGSVTENDKVWRRFTFAPLTTTKVRVHVTNVAGDNRSQVVEIEAYTATASEATIQWLVSDHLGTPRMIFDKTGSLANVKRHDYLPFGEELFAPAGGRSAAQGYASGDGVRQQFTNQERDVETGLDYFGARYFGSPQGRFTSPDPLLQSGRVATPQSWNRYTYVLNNPLRLIDPDGLMDTDPSEDEQKKREQQQQQQQTQVVDLRKDKLITAEVKKIQATAKPLAEGVAPLLSNVRVVVGETSSVNNGTVIDGYGNEATNFTGVVRPVAYIPLDQNLNIIPEGNGTAIVENVKLVSGEKPETTDKPAPPPKGGVFIDVQLLASGKPTTTIEQAVFVGQFPRSGGPATTVFRTATNDITKNADARTVSVKIGSTQKVR